MIDKIILRGLIVGYRVSLVGETYGRLTVTEYAAERSSRGKGNYWECICSCGGKATVFIGNLRSGHTTSCGCANLENIRLLKCDHSSIIGTRTYRAWSNMLTRCTNENTKAFKDYGARGISACKDWEHFPNFLRDMGESPKGLTLERIDNMRGYSKANCQWVTMGDQARNKRNNVSIEYNGKVQCLAAWCEELDLPYGTIWSRLFQHGMPVERAFMKRNLRQKVEDQ